MSSIVDTFSCPNRCPVKEFIRSVTAAELDKMEIPPIKRMNH